MLPEPVLSTLTVSLPSIPCERSELISQPPKEILLWVIIPMREPCPQPPQPPINTLAFLPTCG